MKKAFGCIGIVFLVIMVQHGCLSSNAKKPLSAKNTYTGSYGGRIESKIKIDGSKTGEVYFRLQQPEECINIYMTTTVFADSLTKKEKVLKTYYIVEKGINMSRFPSEKAGKMMFTEIGKNFDYRWNRKRDLLLCNAVTEPLARLEPGIYRIRFTAFTAEEANFKIEIFSNFPIEFLQGYQ